MKRSLYRIISKNFSDVLIKTQRVNLSYLVISCLISSTITIAELCKNFIVPINSPHRKKINEPLKFKHKEKRLNRFLKNERIIVEKLFPNILSLALKHLPRRRKVLVIIDETHLPFNYQAIFSAIAYKGRALPFAFVLFRFSEIEKSQNLIEYEFFKLVAKLFKENKPIFIMDRGYCDVKIVKKLREIGVDFIIRAISNVWVEIDEFNFKGPLGRFREIGFFENCRYHKKEKEVLNIAAGRNEKGENIWVISNLHPLITLELYKLRMQIEETFRDIKSLLGLKKLKLRDDEYKETKLEKILIALMCSIVISAYLEEEAKVYAGGLMKNFRDYSFVRIVKEVVSRLWKIFIVRPDMLDSATKLFPNLSP